MQWKYPVVHPMMQIAEARREIELGVTELSESDMGSTGRIVPLQLQLPQECE